MTANDIITDAMQTIGELAQGQAPSPEDAAYVLTRLNAILDNFSQEEAYIFNRSITAYQLSVGFGIYAIGPTATAPFNVARPTKIDFARILAQMVGSTAYVGVGNLEIIPYGTYVRYADKTSQSLIPESIYYDNAMPNGNLYLFDIPSLPVKLELTAWSQLQQFTSLTTVFALPPGYYEWLVLALGIAIGPAYNKPLDQVTAGRAMECAERIKTINKRILMPGLPPSEYLPPAQPQQRAA